MAGTLLGLTITGCSTQADIISTQTSDPLNSARPPASASASAVVPHDSMGPSSPPEVIDDVLTEATKTVAAFCRPALDQQTWIRGLYPLLSQTAAVAYETVNPARVPCAAVTGDARLRDTDWSYTTRVFVPTDAGEYSVLLNRAQTTDPWLVEQITPYTGG